MSKYRVDRASSLVTPAGMASLLYLGDDRRQAHRIYNNVATGLDAWGRPDKSYGVIVSVWQPDEGKYIITHKRGLRS